MVSRIRNHGDASLMESNNSAGNGEAKPKPADVGTIIGVVKFFKQMAIVKLKDIDSIDEISKYRGMDLLVAREDAVPLKEGEYYISDVLGCKIITDDGEEYGTVSDVIETGANKVLEVKPNKAHSDLKEFYLPYIPDCVLEVNIAERFIRVYLMPGLLD